MKGLSSIHRWGNLMLALVFLMGMLGFETHTAYTQESISSGTTIEPADSTQVKTQNDPTVEAVTCPEDPPMGERARLLDDQEIGLVFYTHDYQESHYSSLNNPREGKDLVYIDDMSCQGGACKSIQSPAITMADIEGNDQSMAVMAFRDSEKRVALGVLEEDGVRETWYGDPNSQGKNVNWIDIAAGNLDGADTKDKSEEVVIAFSDDSHALYLMIPTSIDLPYNSSAYYRDDTSNGRGNVEYVSVATGDLDGDGYDNEIVTVFKDGNKNLQTMIFRKEAGSQVLNKLWARSWTDHYRHGIAYSGYGVNNKHPIDVATGDIDGDFHDEVILAFYDNNPNYSCGQYQLYGKVQIMVLDYIGDGSEKWSSTDIDDSVWIDADPTEGCPNRSDSWGNIWPQSISIAAADLDGDGGDEIALAYTFQNGNPGWFGGNWASYARLWTYEYVGVSDPKYKVCQDDDGNMVPCLQRQHQKLVVSDQSYGTHVYNRITMDAGDLDRDGIAEIAVGYAGYDGHLHVLTYDAKDALTVRKNLTVSSGDQVEEFNLAMGDIDRDAVYGNYKNNHYLSWNSYVEAVVHSPPYWPDDNDEDTEAAFGTSVSHGGGSGKTSETSMGGSVTVKAEFEGVGPSFTADWEKSCAVSQTDVTIETEGTTFKTVPPPGEHGTFYMDAVGYNMCPRCCYEYTEDAHNTPVTICLPTRPCSKAIAGLDAWYKDRPHADPPEGVGDSWVPVGMNLARGKPSDQSSTDYGGVASRAVDGNTDGVFANGSVTFADGGQQAWWQVDMAILPAVHAVQLWNRTDAAPDRLSDFYVFLSEDQFSSNDPDVLRLDPSVWHYYHEGAAERLTTIAWSDFRNHLDEAPERSGELTGRYLRVQLTSDRPLSLAEVQVWGVPSRVDQWPVGEPFPTMDNKSYTVELPDGSNQVVDGEFILKRSGTLHVDDQGSPEFDNSIEEDWEQMVETSTAVDAKVGFSIKYAEAEYTTGSKNVRSRIMTWSKETEFSGEAGMIGENPYYDYAPYMWLQRATSPADVEQSFLVVDYWVPNSQPQSPPDQAANAILPESVVDLEPQTPLIDSSTHLDPDTWYDNNTAIFSWMQPPGDPASVSGYHWYLDRIPDTIPPTHRAEMAIEYTYNNLDDGVWYLHVRAKSEGGVWSETAHRAIRIDTHPPEVELAKDPAQPSGYSGWSNTPLSISVSAQDLEGSGVQSIEFSTDNLTWQPYTSSMLFDTDSSGTGMWARAVDMLGHVSEPVSTTFKIDKTLPDSRIFHGPMPGLLFAEVVSDKMGNEHPMLAGAVEDVLSGQAGMDLEINGFDWTSASQDITDFWYAFPDKIADIITWYFDGFSQISRGNHYLRGHSQDRASNLEDNYDLGELVWFPEEPPDLNGSNLTATPAVTRPGDTVAFVAAVRNSGNQEAWVQLSDTLPTGMTAITDLLPADVDYDPSSRTLTWPAKLLWPGEWHRFHFKVQVDEGLDDMEMENQATAHAYWPNTDDLLASERRRFEEMEQTVDFSTTVTVDPDLPVGVDVLAPWVYLNVLGNQAQTESRVELSIQAAPDAQWMYIREWTLDPESGEWIVAQNSGWRSFNQTTMWTLSPTSAGVKYIGVWVADNEKNVSIMNEHSLDFTNLLSGGPSLADGQKHQYRFELEPGNLSIFNLVATKGDPDLYGWDPYHALLPNYAAEGDQLVDVVGFYPRLKGMHMFEVIARGESVYQLLPATPTEAEEQSPLEAADASKIRPQHPLTVSNPLASGMGTTPGFPDFFRKYIPLIYKE